MDCGSCSVVNAPGRRYCRECGARLGQPCTVCHFFNGVEDKHCGGCGRRFKAGAGPLGADAPLSAYAPMAADGLDFDEASEQPAAAVRAQPAAVEQDVSQSEIDGLFENILDEEPGANEGGRE